MISFMGAPCSFKIQHVIPTEAEGSPSEQVATSECHPDRSGGISFGTGCNFRMSSRPKRRDLLRNKLQLQDVIPTGVEGSPSEQTATSGCHPDRSGGISFGTGCDFRLSSRPKRRDLLRNRLQPETGERFLHAAFGLGRNDTRVPFRSK